MFTKQWGWAFCPKTNNPFLCHTTLRDNWLSFHETINKGGAFLHHCQLNLSSPSTKLITKKIVSSVNKYARNGPIAKKNCEFDARFMYTGRSRVPDFPRKDITQFFSLQFDSLSTFASF